jgi:amino-acid N-acetyltransferase
VAVAAAARSHRLGAGLTAAALDLAAARDVPAVYLLTSTAERYFPRFGFERIERDAVPPGVQTSVEFISACPSSATVMRKILRKTAPRGV